MAQADEEELAKLLQQSLEAQTQGDFAAVRKAAEAGLLLARQIPDKHAEVRLLSLLMAARYRFEGATEAAISCQEEALLIARGLPDKELLGRQLGNLSLILYLAGDSLRCRKYAGQYLALGEELGSLRMQVVARVRLGSTYEGSQEETIAVQHFLTALELLERFTDDAEFQCTWRCQVLLSLGRALTGIRRSEVPAGRASWGEAIRDVPRGIKLIQEAADLAVDSLEADNQDDALFALARTLVLEGQHAEAAAYFQRLEERYAARWMSVEGDEYRRQVRDTARSTEVYRYLQQSLLAAGCPREALLAAERSRTRSFAALLADKHSSCTSDRPSWTGICAAIQGSRATVLYYSQIADASFCVWVLSPSAALLGWQILDIPFEVSTSGETIPRYVSDARGVIFEPSSQGDAGLDGSDDADRAHFCQRLKGAAQKLESLHQSFITPIKNLIVDASDLLVVPDRELFCVPFAAFRDPANQTYLVESHAIRIAPSLCSLLALSSLQTPSLGANVSAAVIGLSDFSQCGLDLGNLAMAEAESEEVCGICRSCGIEVRSLLGNQAGKTRVLEALRLATGLIHFATHGLLEKQCLALHDGALDCDDIVHLDLHAQLAVLSACNTGQGSVGADGIVGLVRSFMAAGVPGVLASLWNIPDRATAHFMKSFYHKILKQHIAPQKAVQMTMREMLHERTTDQFPAYLPHQWAGFVLVGCVSQFDSNDADLQEV